MERANVHIDDYQVLVDTIDDAVAYSCQEAFEEGRLLSGEAAWNIVWVRATAKILEFEGQFDLNKGVDSVKASLQEEKEDTLEDDEHF